MFKKLKKDIISIKKSLTDILATLEYLKLQNVLPNCNNKSGDKLRNLMFDVEGKWVYIPEYLAKKIGIYEGNYFVFGFIANDLIGFSQDTKENMAKINMYCIRNSDCTREDIDKDGVSIYFNENRLGKRIRHIPFVTRNLAESALLALKENILQDNIFVGN